MLVDSVSLSMRSVFRMSGQLSSKMVQCLENPRRNADSLALIC